MLKSEDLQNPRVSTKISYPE